MMDPTLLKGKRVLYYPGSFDPPHEGHVGAVREALIQTKADIAIVRADDSTNTWKPDRLAWEIRTEMLKRTFKDFNNVIVATIRKDQVKEYLQDIYVIALIGSDIWPRYFEKTPASYVKEVVISSRGDSGDIPVIGYPLPITYIWPKIRDCSSTRIRHHLKNRNLREVENLLSCDVIDLIVRNMLYLDAENRGRFIREQIYRELDGKGDPLPKDLRMQGRPVGSEKLPKDLVSLSEKSISGDLTFLWSADATYFVKAFIYIGGSLEDRDPLRRHHHPLRRMDAEIRGLELMSRLNLTYGTAPKIIQFTRHEFGGYLVETCVKGEDLATCGKNYDRQGEFGDMCYLVGQALHELHATKRSPIDIVHFETNFSHKHRFGQWIIRMERKIKEFLEELRSLVNTETFTEVKTSLETTLTLYRGNPGDYTYVHGDANLGNFFVTLSNGSDLFQEAELPEMGRSFVELSTNRVTLVDLNSMGTALGEHDSPLGFPAYEYHQFLASTVHWGVTNNIPEHIMKHASERFTQGYGICDTFTREASDFYSVYWGLRSTLCRLAHNSSKSRL